MAAQGASGSATGRGRSDPADPQAGVAAVAGIGSRLALATAAAGLAYCLATLDQPHRRLVASLFCAWAAAGLAASLLPRERIRGGWAEVLLGAWSALGIGLTAAVAAADGGAASPLALLFFVPVAFAALCYPTGLLAAVALVDYGAYLGIGVAGAQPDPARFGFFAFCLGAVATLCVVQARVQERRREALLRVSRADPVTGGLNARGFEERLGAELSRASRSGRPLALVVVEVSAATTDDRRHSPASDELLLWALEVMQETLRPMDSLGRTGQSRIAAVVPGAGPDDAAAVAGRLRESVASRASASIGLACFPVDGVDREELERHAQAHLGAGGPGHQTERRGTKELSWATTLARAVDERMSVQHEHSWQVAEYATAIAERMGWPQRDLELLRMAAILHDVGKVSVPDHVLRKREPLTEREWLAVRKAPLRGAEMVSRIAGLESVAEWIRHSHERFDGRGYPLGLAGDAIPPASRILLVADAFDAMVGGRPYRAPVAAGAALEELRLNAGSQFDPACVELLEDHIELSEPA